ncbi:MAG: transketolase C-terminal domain-containing protein [Propionibacteriaceae bacterium]
MSVQVREVLSRPAVTVDAPFARALAEIATRRPDVAVLAADLSKYTDVGGFAEAHPERFVQIGMAEQNLMGVAAGLAKTGLVPIITTYCVFATRRSYEQVALALNTARRPLVIAAFLPGITTPFRATHQGTDDLALMRNIPGLTVIDPMDATELAAALVAAVELGGPVYLRGLRGQVRQHLDPATYRFEVGRTHLLRSGPDVGVIATGLGSEWALEAAEELAGQGVETAVLHVPTVKPLDREAIRSFCDSYDVVHTLENHARTGGLGTAVAEVLAETGSRTRLRRLGVPDAWAPAGSLDYIRGRLGLDAVGLAQTMTSGRDGHLDGGPA